MANIKLNYAHICDLAFSDKDGKANIIGIFKNINSDEPVAVHPRFSVITEIQGDEGTYHELLTLKNRTTNEEIAHVEGDPRIISNNGMAIFAGHFLMMSFNFPGEYVIEIKVTSNGSQVLAETLEFYTTKQ